MASTKWNKEIEALNGRDFVWVVTGIYCHADLDRSVLGVFTDFMMAHEKKAAWTAGDFTDVQLTQHDLRYPLAKPLAKR